MNMRRGGLGRGLGALIPTGPDAHRMHGVRYGELAVDSIRPNPRQPRGYFDEESLQELVASIREVGLLQPIVVRETEGDHYQLVMGERRWRAARLAGLAIVPAIIRATEDDAMLRDALLENLHRQELNPLEEAAAYQQMLDDFHVTHEELAGRLGRSRPQVSNTLRLLGLPATVQRKVAAGILTAGHARALLSLAEPSQQEALATRIVAEGMSVRAVEELVATGEGEGSGRRRTAGPRVPQAPALAELSARLSERFETRVKVELGRRRGRLTMDFASLDDLERILADLAPGTPLWQPDRTPESTEGKAEFRASAADDSSGGRAPDQSPGGRAPDDGAPRPPSDVRAWAGEPTRSEASRA